MCVAPPGLTWAMLFQNTDAVPHCAHTGDEDGPTPFPGHMPQGRAAAQGAAGQGLQPPSTCSLFPNIPSAAQLRQSMKRHLQGTETARPGPLSVQSRGLKRGIEPLWSCGSPNPSILETLVKQAGGWGQVGRGKVLLYAVRRKFLELSGPAALGAVSEGSTRG